MDKVYKTISGDTWDKIAKEVYGDETYTSFLMKMNSNKLDFFVFPDGIVLDTPRRDENNTNMPNWRM